LGFTTLSAQQSASPALDEAIWRQIEQNLQQQSSAAFFKSTAALVRGHCDSDYECLRQTYYGIMFRLERRFRLSAAIQVGEELVQIARKQGDQATEADVYLNLNRFHNALGNTRPAVESLQKATHIFEQTGNRSAITHARITRLEQGLDFHPLEDVLPEMEALLAESVANGDTESVRYLHIRLLLHTQTLGRYEEMEKHIVALEGAPLSDPIRPEEYGQAIHAALGRADLAVIRNRPEEAERYYQKTLRLCEAEPSRWLEIHVLLALAGLEWKRHNTSLAKTYLDKAESKALALELDDLLTRVYASKAGFAEAEGRYADALHYLKKKAVHEEKFKEKSAGFDLKNYYLQLEKDQLALENENRKLELAMQGTQLRNSLIILLLACMLAAGFLVAYARQRRQKRLLAEQNSLILKQAEELRSLDRLKSRFFANISHELRTPLTLILGPVEQILKNKPMDSGQTALLETVRRNAARLLGMVNEILQLNKLEAAAEALNIQRTLVYYFLQDEVNAFSSLAESRSISLELQGAPDPGWAAGLDRNKTETILRNLLSNALRFTPAGGRVTVSAEQLPDGVQFAVRDTGTGIHPDDLPHIFDLYYQSIRPETSAEGGTGIGLTLSRELAAAMSGRLWAENNPDRGCTFWLYLPGDGGRETVDGGRWTGDGGR
jgi:signal transduction histidine kinase